MIKRKRYIIPVIILLVIGCLAIWDMECLEEVVRQLPDSATEVHTYDGTTFWDVYFIMTAKMSEADFEAYRKKMGFKLLASDIEPNMYFYNPPSSKKLVWWDLPEAIPDAIYYDANYSYCKAIMYSNGKLYYQHHSYNYNRAFKRR